MWVPWQRHRTLSRHWMCCYIRPGPDLVVSEPELEVQQQLLPLLLFLAEFAQSSTTTKPRQNAMFCTRQNPHPVITDRRASVADGIEAG